MRETHVPIGALVAAIGGIVLIVSLGLDWYSELSGFTSFEVWDLVLVLLALVALAALASALGLVRLPLGSDRLLAASLLALVIVGSQLINHPPAGTDRELETGAWLGLAGAALMAAGAVLSTARIAIAVEPRARASAPASGSPAAPPPADEAPTVREEPPPASRP